MKKSREKKAERKTQDDKKTFQSIKQPSKKQMWAQNFYAGDINIRLTLLRFCRLLVMASLLLHRRWLQTARKLKEFHPWKADKETFRF